MGKGELEANRYEVIGKSSSFFFFHMKFLLQNDVNDESRGGRGGQREGEGERGRGRAGGKEGDMEGEEEGGGKREGERGSRERGRERETAVP